MPVIETKIDRQSADYEENLAANTALAAELKALCERITAGGSARARERHLVRGKLLVRDRIETLTDADTDFLEVGLLAAHEVYRGWRASPAASDAAASKQFPAASCGPGESRA